LKIDCTLTAKLTHYWASVLILTLLKSITLFLCIAAIGMLTCNAVTLGSLVAAVQNMCLLFLTESRVLWSCSQLSRSWQYWWSCK